MRPPHPHEPFEFILRVHRPDVPAQHLVQEIGQGPCDRVEQNHESTDHPDQAGADVEGVA